MVLAVLLLEPVRLNGQQPFLGNRTLPAIPALAGYMERPSNWQQWQQDTTRQTGAFYPPKLPGSAPVEKPRLSRVAPAAGTRKGCIHSNEMSTSLSETGYVVLGRDFLIEDSLIRWPGDQILTRTISINMCRTNRWKIGTVIPFHHLIY